MSSRSTPGVAVRKIWRALVPPGLRRYGQGAAIALARRRVSSALAAGEPPFAAGPVIISGLLSGTSGVSRAARLTVQGIRHGGYRPIEQDLAPLFAAGDSEAGGLPAAPPGGVWVLHVNAPEAVAAMSRIPPDAWRGRYRIGFWAYELPVVPSAWAKIAPFFHELWAPSRFVADAIAAAGVKTPVRVMPHPVALSAPNPDPVRRDGPFTVLAMGDLSSSWARKNLLGSVEIFKRAFPDVSPGARRLIVKVQSTFADPRFASAIHASAAGRRDISLVDQRLSDVEIERLVASASVFLSPHRSEGYGLVIAEALLAGVPALATGWSGNVDFMHDIPELSIAYKLVPVRDAGGVYKDANACWAEPDIADAVEKLRALETSPDLKQATASRGGAAVRAQLDAWTPAAFVAMPFGKFAMKD